MEFLSWHYSKGIQFFLTRVFFTIAWINHQFSLQLLISSLFAPYKRLVITSEQRKNSRRIFESISYNLVSRIVGAIVRLSLFFAGSFLIFIVLFSSAIGLFVWLAIPIIGFAFYEKIKRHPKYFAKNIQRQISQEPHNWVNILFSNEAGRFLLQHSQLALEDLEKDTQKDGAFIASANINSYSDLIKLSLENLVWSSEFLRSHNINTSDLVLLANSWDKEQLEKSSLDSESMRLGRPGIGLELLFGFTPTLNRFSVDLSTPQSFGQHLIGRQQVVSRIERAMSSGNSVILVGQPGVGKKTVVLEFAKRAIEGEFGADLAYRRVVELDYNFILADNLDVNVKKTNFEQVLEEAKEAGNIILVIRDLHRLTNSLLEGLDFTDMFEKVLEKRSLKIITILSQSDYERYFANNLRLKKFFEVIEVESPNKDEAMQILMESSRRWEKKLKVLITIQALRNILVNSDKFITEIPFPEKAIEILDASVTLAYKESKKVVNIDEVNQVFAEKTGISLARLTQSEKADLSHIEDLIHKNLVNQEAAVSLIGKSLRARTMGVKEDSKPIGSFLFLGPTGVGKTQTAKVLSQVYFGSEKQILRFDMAEFSGSEGLERLIGSQSNNQPGILTTAIKNKPSSLLLLDEIEKSPSSIYNLLLTLLDEGYVTDAFGRKVDCRNLFVIATSNAGSQLIRNLVTSGTKGENLQRQVIEHVQQERIFSPEFLNRFDGVVVFEPLNQNDLIEVARLMVLDLKSGLEQKNIYLEVADELVKKVATDGYDPAFGARPMRRVLDLNVGDVLSKAILSGEIKEGDKIKIVVSEGGEYQVEKI